MFEGYWFHETLLHRWFVHSNKQYLHRLCAFSHNRDYIWYIYVGIWGQLTVILNVPYYRRELTPASSLYVSYQQI